MPQKGSAPSKRRGCRWTRPAVIMPPIDSPQAMVRRGRPKRSSKRSSRSIWSRSASSTAQPLDAYEDPASAKPSASSWSATVRLPAVSAGGFGMNGGT
jgi:hypothetical protein